MLSNVSSKSFHICAKDSSVRLYMEISQKAYGSPVYVCMSSAVLSSECVKALQPPISEEAVCLVGRVLVVTSS